MPRTSCLSAFVAFVCVSMLSTPAFAARPCPSDTNCSGTVDIDDLTSVILTWGACSSNPCAGDVNADNQVNIDDLTAVILTWGSCVFQYQPAYPNAEAEQVGLEFLGSFGPMLLPQSTYNRVNRDLSL